MMKPGFLFLHILDALEKGEETTFGQIDEELGISSTAHRRTLEELVREGFVEKKDRDGQSYYSIADKGRSLGAFHQIEDFAGYLDFVVADEDLRKKVLEGIRRINADSSESEVAKWYQRAMENLDELVDKRTKTLVMEHCGFSCALGNKSHIDAWVETRRKYKSIDEYLEAEAQTLSIVREGNTIIQTYKPQETFNVRCYCSLVRGLPPDETISLTYCNCSKGFVKKFWEAVPERPVQVELVQSVMSGAPNCKFEVRM
jgi:predicted transcriptional regulator